MVTRNRPKPPFMLKAMRYSIRALTLLSPPLAARFVNYLWFKTQRYPEPRREQKILKTAEWKIISFEKKRIQLYIWGSCNKPTVLLVHGWNGRGTQLGDFVSGLVERGYRVIAFDAPGHGRSSTNSTSLPEISRVIQVLSQQYGPFKAGVAHSFGGLCLMHAISSAGIKTNKVVCIASAFNAERLVQVFARILQVQPPIVERQKRLLEHQFGEQVWEQFSMPHMVGTTSSAGLIIHDEDDDAIPVERSKMIADAWHGSELVLTTGLGHRRILRDKTVINKVISFITT